jgi:mannose-P-dolichol utilization defect protein 1
MDALRSALQPITHNLPGPIRDLGVSIIGDTCYKALLLDVDLENTECVKLAVSKALGIGIVGASSIVKVPQIVKLVQSQSASGVSFLSYLLETSSYLISLAYNYRNAFPFSTYGETALVLGQNVIITVLVLNYSGRAGMAALFVAALATSVVTLFNENILDMQKLSYLQVGAGALGVASKIPQILAIWQEGGTGQLSAFAVSFSRRRDYKQQCELVWVTWSLTLLLRIQVFNYLLGSLTRIFTTLQEVDDKLILYGFVAGFALNLVLALQMVYYWNAPSAKAKGKRKEVPVEAPSSATATAVPKSKGPTTRRRG